MAKSTEKTVKAVKPTVEKTENQMPTTEELMAKMAEMQEKMNAWATLFNPNMMGQPTQTITDPEEEVISLTHGLLNLTTEGNGKGTLYEFKEFGETQKVPTSDLKMILKNNKQFALDGRFYITNPALIKANNLTGAYKNIVKHDIFNELFSLPKASFLKTFESMPEIQQKVFADLLMSKAYNNEEVDLNIVGMVGEILKRDLMQEVQATKVVYKKVEN
jgi:hypothetical protein